MRFFLLAAALVFFQISRAQAEPVNTDDLAFSLGSTGIFNGHDDSALSYGAEYRYKDIYYGLRPMAGVWGAANGSAYGYAGANWDLPLDTAPWVITPSLAAGAYRQGGGPDLGQALEFRSGIEIAYQCEDGARLGAQLFHISNAGMADENPGMEAVQVVYSLPLGGVF